MNWQRATRIFIFVIVAIIALYDLAAAAFGGADGTISLQLFHMTGDEFKAKSLLFAAGYLCGHIFGRVDK